MSALGSYFEVIDPHNNALDDIGKNGAYIDNKCQH